MREDAKIEEQYLNIFMARLNAFNNGQRTMLYKLLKNEKIKSSKKIFSEIENEYNARLKLKSFISDFYSWGAFDDNS